MTKSGQTRQDRTGREPHNHIERYDPTRDRAALAGALGGARPARHGPRRRHAAQVLPADDVPVSVGRPAHRPLVHRHADATRWRASTGCTATTCSSRSGSMPSACPPRTRRSRTAAIRSPGRWPTSRTCAASSGRWARRSTGSTRSSLPTRVLQVEPVVVPALPGARPGVPGESAVDWCPNDGTLAREQVEGDGPALLALRRPGREARPGAVVPAHHAVRRRAARLRRHRLARADQDPCRPTGSAGPRAPRSTSRSAPTTTSRAATICASSRPGPTRCSGRPSWSSRPSIRWSPKLTHARAPGRGRGVRRAGAPADRDRAPVDRPRRRPASPSAPTRSTRSTASASRSSSPTTCWPATAPARSWPCPAHDERDFEFARKFGLPDPAGRRRARRGRPTSRWRTRTSRTPRTSAWSTAARSTGCPPTRAARRSSPGWPRRGTGRAQGHLPPARLAGQPPALLGHADPGHLLPDARHRARARRGPAGAAAGDVDYAGSGDNPLTHDEAFLHVDLPALRRARPGARRTRWTRSWTRRGTGSATCRRTSRTARSTAR